MGSVGPEFNSRRSHSKLSKCSTLSVSYPRDGRKSNSRFRCIITYLTVYPGGGRRDDRAVALSRSTCLHCGAHAADRFRRVFGDDRQPAAAVRTVGDEYSASLRQNATGVTMPILPIRARMTTRGRLGKLVRSSDSEVRLDALFGAAGVALVLFPGRRTSYQELPRT
ncbi:DUF7563 family protein [Halosolutus halophilus]|uniref:DUF7563 family protein n=1 Tax=Halosolutus halophilus TaxID=1552990 RepID=UPI003CE473CB